ncbi:MAG TPA: efflux RND transporter periplasmic adaptor subunit [Candidatus Binatia bacterium]|nr:efflux RND transporter periplasmic adaptor subunit [Candidatus Binatia bacterium]
MCTRRRPRGAAWASVGIALGVWACGSRPAPAPPPPKVKVVHPVARDVTEWDEYTARLDAVDSVEVRPRVSGYLQSVHFQDGALVHKGDLLFQIDPRPYEATLRRGEAEVQTAKSRLVLAQKNFARAADLLASHAISQEEADIRQSNLRQAEAAVDEAQAVVDSARLDVEFTHVTAPVSGRVSRKIVTEGNLITGGVGTQGTLLTTIVSLDPIYAYFDADEGALLKYNRLARLGQRPSSRDYKNPVRVALADEEGFPHPGTMDFVDNQVDRGTGTIVGRAVLPNPDLSLIPGLFARLQLPGSGQYRAILVPDEAIASDQSQKLVWVIDGEKKAQYRPVKIGPLIDGLRVVREGVTDEDWIVVAGLQRVRPGQPVEPEQGTIAQ